MKKKRRKLRLTPPLGPPENLRPAGAHESQTAYRRNKMKAALRKALNEAQEGRLFRHVRGAG